MDIGRCGQKFVQEDSSEFVQEDSSGVASERLTNLRREIVGDGDPGVKHLTAACDRKQQLCKGPPRRDGHCAASIHFNEASISSTFGSKTLRGN
jgi:hypothetical protein